MHAALVQRVARSSLSAVGRAVDVAPSTVGRWVRNETEPTGSARERLFTYLEHRAQGAPVAGREPLPHDTATIQPQLLQGRSVEVEALLAYALERQRLVTDALADLGAALEMVQHMDAARADTDPAPRRSGVLRRTTPQSDATAPQAGGPDRRAHGQSDRRGAR